MKDHLNAAVRSFAASLCFAALSALLIASMLSLYDIPRSMELAILVWLALLAAQSIVNEHLVSRGSTLLVFAAFNALLLFFGVRALCSHTVFLPGSQGFPAFLGMLAWSVGLFNAWASQHTPGSNLFVRMADALICMIALYMGVAFGMGKSIMFPVLAFSMSALALAIALTAILRAGGESDSVIRGVGAGGFFVVGALLLLCFVCTAGVLSLAEGHVDSLVALLVLLWQGVGRVCSVLLQILARIILLFSGAPKYNRVTPVYDEQPIPISGGAEAIEGPAWLPYLFLAALAAGAVLLIVLLLRMLHGMNLTRTPVARRRRKVTRTSHVLSALLALLRRIRDRIRFELSYRIHRHTPQGLLILAQRTGLLHRLPRRKSESGGAYLRRLHTELLRRSLPSSLDTLADTLDAVLYGGMTIRLSPQESGEYERQIKSLNVPKSSG